MVCLLFEKLLSVYVQAGMGGRQSSVTKRPFLSKRKKNKK